MTIDGRAIVKPGPERGVMFQDYALFPWQTVRGNVEFGLLHGPAGRELDSAGREQRVRSCIELVGLTGAETKYPHQLSGGMRQRVALARLMAIEPEVLLMDEPLAALDAQTRIILQEELLRIWGQDRPASERRTVVFITHAIDEAVFLSNRIVSLGRAGAGIAEDVAIDLPYPRDQIATRAEPRFTALRQRLFSSIFVQEKTRAAPA